MNIVSKFLVGGTIAGTMLTSCDSNYKKFEEYMGNRPYSETLEIKNKCRREIWAEDTQRYLDSIAFRDVLKSTDAINNSKIVTDFNKIASYNKAIPIMTTDDSGQIGGTVTKAKRSLLNKLINLNISKNEYEKMIKLNNQELQYTIDSITYNKFFEKYNLLNSSVKKQIKAICKQIKP